MTPEALQAALEAGANPSILDTREPPAFARAHLPGSFCIPAGELQDRYGELDRLSEAWVIVPPKQQPEAPAALLRKAGFERVSVLEGGLTRWTGAVERGSDTTHESARKAGTNGDSGEPAVCEAARLLTQHVRAWGRVLDLACGDGTNSVYLAAQDLEVVAVDRDATALATAEEKANAADVSLKLVEADLETVPPGWTPDPESFDAVLVSRYLWRPYMRQLVAAIRPGGVIAYETFTEDQARFGKPTNPDFLLKARELSTYFPGWSPLVDREGPVAARRARALWLGRKPMRAP